MILAIDIGGTKFTMAVFDGGRMVRRESRATDAGGGREWMLGQIREIAGAWQNDFRFERCGIGFGGPVNYAAQRVVLSTHVGGWRDFDLCAYVQELTGAAAVMDNDANVGALGEAHFGRGPGLLAGLLHDSFHRHWRRHLCGWHHRRGVGGVLINMAFRQSFLTAKTGDPAFWAFIAFYVVCIAVTYVVYLRPAPLDVAHPRAAYARV